MATLALAAVGAAVGSAVMPAGVTLFGATLSGAAIGSQIGAFAGSYVDQKLLATAGGSGPYHGPRLSDLHVTSSTEGAPLPRVYGRARLGGQVIWADEIEEERVTSSAGGGGKGGGSGGGATTVTYRYYASFAVAIAAGVVTNIGRVWADGKELDLTDVTYRFHDGSETQIADELIAAKLGVGEAPAYRGVAYIVFERLPLAQFGNRLPQLAFEAYRDLDPIGRDIRGVVLIPGSGEFAYSPEPVTRNIGAGSSVSENVHTRQGGTDWAVSLDQMAQALPRVESVSLVTSWFGSDLRAGLCTIRPAIETRDKVTHPFSWAVAGLTRASAPEVSRRDGRPAYGGTPSDSAVVAAIRDLKARGYAVTLTPFILMDVPDDNGLADPYTGEGRQPSYPWRGRITCDPAPGAAGSVDKTAAAEAQVQSFCGMAQVSHFAVVGDRVIYTGPIDWGLRRMVLHYAHLATAAGGVDTFVIGTELRGLTQVRSSAATYPFVSALVQLADDVKSVLGPATKVTYAADWSEYFGHQPVDGTGDVYFNLDALWASPSIDAVGIDVYWPLADWRAGRDHLDYLAGAPSIYDTAYLAGNAEGGEGYDWYYASAADRDAQVRSPITDGSGKPWLFRYKDIRSWWSEQHFDRPGGIEQSTASAWIPKSKPLWFMETGCPAVDLGANQPNVFVDAKSAESAVPYYAQGIRDDLMQRQYLRALIGAFDPSSPVYGNGNPISPVYGGRMVDTSRIYVYAWDARPFPAFPANIETWSDADNWRLGHWLSGRIAGAPLSHVIDALMDDFGHENYDASGLFGIVPGYVVDRVMSARDALEPLGLAYFFDPLESGGRIVFRQRASAPAVMRLGLDDLVEQRAEDALLMLTRGQETELPASTKISYLGAGGDYRQAVAESRRLVGASVRVSQAELPLVLDAEHAGRIADSWLHETWISRERASFTLPPSGIAVEPGDVVSIDAGTGQRLFRVTSVGEDGTRAIEALAVDPSIYEVTPVAVRPLVPLRDVSVGQPHVYFLDLPMLRGDEAPEAGYVVARQEPWPGSVALYASPEGTGFALKALIASSATLGMTLSDLAPGPEGRIDCANDLLVEVSGGALASVTTLQMLGGRNVAAVRNGDGDWQLLQFERAELIAAGTYRLSRLLRAQAGTDGSAGTVVPAGAPFVLLDQSRTEVTIDRNEIGLPYTWKYGPSSKSIGDVSYGETVHAFVGVGLRPLSPVHIRSRREITGDIAISWIRRTRIGGDNWEAAEVPLGETAETYALDILDGSDVKRTFHATASSIVYTDEDQIADFGSRQPSYQVRVYQLSPEYGRGTGRAAVI
ncbi:MAG: glycoside hydrolase/phage tail family protein [Hyphomicrobiaceae bacterium]|nr:glycoside hydrolase/phage tail family protein [Hyphomicrobiaceae bacterium]